MLDPCPQSFLAFLLLRSPLAIALIYTKQGKYVHLNIWAVSNRCYYVLAKRRLCVHHQWYLPWNLGLEKGLKQHTSTNGDYELDWDSKQMGNCGLESQLDQELETKRMKLKTKRNLPTALRNGEKYRELKRVHGYHTCVPHFPWSNQKFTSDPSTATKSVKKQNST